eukprot:TRINITY_DN7_c0_g1_i1.p1 TRINITY_DN7_c0_g1~~TRINITY_DN7_c0_g1_i1.p1  ORF type:complete len:248 (+),score=17.60 TRINITY_DN7_c0_g1_i1:119-862(+)
MASVTMQAATAVVAKSTFLGAGQSRLARSTRAAALPTSISALKIEAKGNWLPGSTSPAWLDGSLPGDNGFDPLALAEDPENLRWYVQAELQNGRWAMLGVAGMIIPEALTSAGLLNAPVWYDHAAVEYAIPIPTLTTIMFLAFNFVELRRWQDFKNPGSMNVDPIHGNVLAKGDLGYPGFNPLGFGTDFRTKESELANGRTAMVAFLGMIIQAHITGAGPFANLVAHLSDPWNTTVFQSLDAFFAAQ